MHIKGTMIITSE